MDNDAGDSLNGIAIIGMSGRFPGAKSIDQFWLNLRDGVGSTRFFSDDELMAANVDPAVLKSKNYVKANGMLDDAELFDAAFFGMSAREAALMDPQHRLFLMCVWEALENAGYDPETFEGLIGIYGGMGVNHYLIKNILSNPDVVASEGPLQLRILNDKDFLVSFTSYKLNLRGPSVNVQTACSTSLVAASLACQSLLNYQCDIALAGGVAISLPQISGYFYQEEVFSPDGYCRAFDATAQGTVGGSGIGIVVLKRLADAIADGDSIRAVIRGSAINNDGSLKVGYTAPSVNGQAEVIGMAQAVAGVEPDTITYIEAHGTATPLGDPVEIAALTQVFRASTQKNGFCRVGSVKTNIGHLDAAAGVASLIKTVLSLEHEMLPPSLHYTRPNPEIDFENSPFYVNARLSEWKTEGGPRRAGVSSFAVGGVNAHLVIEEAPAIEPSSQSRPGQLLLLSARTSAALEKATDNLAAHLKQHPEQNLADIAYTLQVGRRGFAYRRALVCRDRERAIAALETNDPRQVLTGMQKAERKSVIFMFSGIGNHYVDMGLELYQHETAFRETVDNCCELLKPHLGIDLRDTLYPGRANPDEATRQAAADPGFGRPRIDLRKMLRREDQTDEATRSLNQSIFSQPALFVVEYALARLWMRWGVNPDAMIGYSIGEYTAACLAEVLSLEDALYVVARRALLVQELAGGAMLAVPLSEEEIRPLLDQRLSIAASNGPAISVIAGPADAIDEVANHLAAKGLTCQRLQVAHAFHSNMMRPILQPLKDVFKSVRLNPPKIPYVSNVTGTWITTGQATDPNYWCEHLCKPVRFGEGVRELWKKPSPVLLEVGPGQALCGWAMQHPSSSVVADRVVLASLRHSFEQQSDIAFLLNTLGRLWLAGVEIDGAAFYAGERRLRLPLPSYPFELQPFWIESQTRPDSIPAPGISLDNGGRDHDRFYIPIWKQSRPVCNAGGGKLKDEKNCWLIFVDECGLGQGVAQRLCEADQTVIRVSAGTGFKKTGDTSYVINAQERQDYEALLDELRTRGDAPAIIVHAWSITRDDYLEPEIELSDKHLALGFYSLLLLAQTFLSQEQDNNLRLVTLSNNMYELTGEAVLHPAKATLLGPVKVISQEYPGVTCRSLDVIVPESEEAKERLIDQLIAELIDKPSEPVVSYRGGHRWIQTFEPIQLEATPEGPGLLKERGVYLITGGTGGIGLVLAEYLARTARARLVLVGRSIFPNRDSWPLWLSTHDYDDELSLKMGKIQAIERLGSEVEILSADVADYEQMRDAISRTLNRFGTISGVIHAAGVQPGGMIQLKTLEKASGVLRPKVKGTLVLYEALKDVKLDFFILCSSLNSIIGTLGLVDHCAANAFLDAFAHSKTSERDWLTLSINWDSWREVGQAANAALSTALKEISQINIDPVHPLLDECVVDGEDQQIYSSTFSTGKHWILNEHRIKGIGVVPGTAYLEMARAAFEKLAGGATIVMRNVVFLSPLAVKDGETKEVRTIIKKHGDGFEFLILSKYGSQWHEHTKGQITFIESPVAAPHSIPEIMGRNSHREINFHEESEPDRSLSHLSFGPRWKNLLKRLHVGDKEALAIIELPVGFSGDLATFKMHPSLLDAATGFTQLIGEGFYLPLAYERLKFIKPLPRKVYSHAKFKANNPSNQEVIACDITIMDEQGNELVEIGEFTLRRVDDPATIDTGRGPHAPALEQGSNHHAQQAAGRGGLSPDEGAEAFGQILRGKVRVPQIAVSTRELLSLIQRSSNFTTSRVLEDIEKLQALRKKHPRPNLSTPFIEPRNEVERKLAEMWQQTLGIDQVGAFDSFFDLGGDSLLAAHFISRAAETFPVNLSLRTLFNSPTVADLSVIIVQEQAGQADSEAVARVLDEINNLSESDLQKMLAAEMYMRAQEKSNE